MIEVIIDVEYIALTSSIAARRKFHGVLINQPETWGKSVGDPFLEQVYGATAERIVSKWLNLPWKSFFEKPWEIHGDVGGCEVRHTRHRSGHLRNNPGDKKDPPYILVVGEFPKFTICGWAYGRDIQQQKYFRPLQKDKKRPAFWMPQEDLQPLDTLKAMVDGGVLA